MHHHCRLSSEARRNKIIIYIIFGKLNTFQSRNNIQIKWYLSINFLLCFITIGCLHTHYIYQSNSSLQYTEIIYINDELDSLEFNRTWHLVDLPDLSCKAIDCKWILRKKLKPDRSIYKYKARLVAKGFRQRKNIDFFDTFSPTTDFYSFH